MMRVQENLQGRLNDVGLELFFRSHFEFVLWY